MKQKFTYLLSLMLMCILGASNAMAETVVFSADVIASSDQAFSPGTTEITSAHATLVGGTMSAISEQADNKNLIGHQGSNRMFCMTNNNTFFKIVLDEALANGDVINCMTYSRTDTGLGVWVSTASSRPNSCSSALSIAAVGTAAYEKLSSYTVTDGDGLAGATTIYLYRETGKSTYFDEFTITRASQEPEPGPGPEPVAPTIVNDLKSTYDVTVGKSITLTIEANDATGYQWYQGAPEGTAISGATKASYTYTPAEVGTTSFYCVVSNANGNVQSKVAAVTASEWKPITTKRNWLFTQQSKYADDQAAATSLWTNYSSSNKRYENARALVEEELSGNNGPLSGLAGIYFTAPSNKLLLGGKDDNSRSVQTNGNGISMTIPQCNVKDKITLRWSASGSGKDVSITYGNQTISCNGVNRNNTGDLIAEAAGDVTIGIPNGARIFEVTVTPYIAVKDFELSTDEVSVEEYENVSVSAKNFTPSNCSDNTIEWTTSDAAVATVTNGVITGVKAGTATITATSVDGPSKTVAVTVTPSAPKNLSIEMTSTSEAIVPKVESGKTYKLTAKVQGYDLTCQWASKDSEKGAYTNISGATAQTYETTAVELGSKFYKVTVTNAQGSAVAEYEVKTVVPLEAFAITEVDTETGATTTVNYKAIDADEPQVRVVSQQTKASEETHVVLPASVEYKGLEYAVTVIGDEAYVNDNTVVSLATPKSMKEIGARAFMSCTSLSQVLLNDGLEIIGDAAFSGCNSLTEFYIPSSVEVVGFKAFANCESLTDIYYDGTKDEWYALPNVEMAGIAKSVTIHFNDGETENGKGNIVGINNAEESQNIKEGKFFDGKDFFIYKNGKKYTAAGAEM